MKRTFKLFDWQVECGKASKDGTLRDLIKSIGRGEVEVTDDTGRKLDFSPGPTHVDTAPLPPFPVRDAYGRVIVEAARPKPVPQRVSQGFTLENRQSFEDEIQHEPEAAKTSLRLQYDKLRKEHGID